MQDILENPPEPSADELMAMLEGMDLESIPPEILEVMPDELRQMLEEQADQKAQRLSAIANAITRKRTEAIAGRKSSGIEDEWSEVQDAYEGIDDANRHEHGTYKPDASGSFQTAKRTTNRSTVFVNITAPYVDGAAARMADILLPTDDRPWSIRPTPIPDTKAQRVAPDALEQALAAAKEKAKNAEKRIEDWLTECQWHGEVRKVIEDSARLGTGVLKGPMPRKRRYQQVAQDEHGGATLQVETEIVPVSVRVNPWNLFPDPACGNNIHNGNYLFERDYITARQLRDLIGVDGYLSPEIDKALKAGPGRREVDNVSDGPTFAEGDKFEIWHYHGMLSPEDLQICGCNPDDTEQEVIPAIVTMVGDYVIKAAVSHLESGDFPYDVLAWRQRDGLPWGIGVGKQIRTPQRMLNAAVRNLMDNAGLSSGPQTVMRKGAIIPADGKWELTARKLWFLNEGADVDDVRKALFSFDIPSMQGELMGIINFALKMAEDVTGLPMLMQGQAGQQAPDTVGGMQILNNNANTVLRRLAKSFDDAITEPHIRRYYEWIMIYGEDTEKGDYTVDARGSSALVERDIQNQAIMQMAEMALNPVFGVDPKKWFSEMCKAQHLDPSRFQADEEGQQQIPPEVQQHIQQLEEALQQATQDAQGKQIDAQSRVQVAQIREEGRIATENMRLQYRKQIDQTKQELEQRKLQLKEVELQIKAGQLEEKGTIDMERLLNEREALLAQITFKEREFQDIQRAATEGLGGFGQFGRENAMSTVKMNDQYALLPGAVG